MSPSRPGHRRPAAARLGTARVLVALGAALAAAAPVAARAADFKWHGLLDLVASERTAAFDQNLLTRRDSPYDPYRLRLFAESQVDEHVQFLGQLVNSDAIPPYVDAAYVVVTPWPERDLHLLAGKIPWAIGTYGPRTYSNRNPLIGTPLLYQYHTTLLWYDVPPGADALLATAGSGQSGVNYFGYPEGLGMPIVDDSYWDVGVTLAGSARPLEYAVGVNAGTPSWGSTSKDDNSGKSVLGRIGLAPAPWLRLGVSGAFGPYLKRSVASDLPAGADVNDYAQKLVMADLELLLNYAELRAEAARNVWETPYTGELAVNAGYAEVKYLLPSGMYLAGRWDVESFSEIAGSSGAQRPWDWDVTRAEAGVGYRVTRDATVKLVYQQTMFDTGAPGPQPPDRSIFAAQAAIGF